MKKYEEPNIEIYNLDMDYIITTSGDSLDNVTDELPEDSGNLGNLWPNGGN